MKTVDITIDLETCALCPTAAVMSIGAVAWNRHGKKTPFFKHGDNGEECFDPMYSFSTHIDMRTEFLDGFTFDQQTADWWARQSKEAKDALTEHDEEPAKYIEYAVKELMEFIECVKENTAADRVCLWCQGTDFDIAILRNICYKYGINIPVSYKHFRDHRTFFMETAELICDITDTEFIPDRAYKMVDDYTGPNGAAAHDPLFDCMRSIHTTWQMMNHLRCLKQEFSNG